MSGNSLQYPASKLIPSKKIVFNVVNWIEGAQLILHVLYALIHGFCPFGKVYATLNYHVNYRMSQILRYCLPQPEFLRLLVLCGEGLAG